MFPFTTSRRTKQLHAHKVRSRTEKQTFGRSFGVEVLESRLVLSGVTLITHGFNSDADSWVTAMAEAIGQRADLAIDQAIYRIEVTDPGHDGGA